MAFVKASTQYKRENKTDYGKEKIQLLYEDQWIAVIFKPNGLLSVPYPGSKGRTAQSALEDILRKKGSYNSRHRPFVVHRLDRDTSGVMMFALTESAQKIIMEKWHVMVTERLYRAVAELPELQILPDCGLISDPLAMNAHNVGFVPKKGDVDKNGRAFKTVEARTHYKIIAKGKTHALFELSLDTGKKNQIRAHLAGKGYPLAGDEEHRAKTDHFHRLCLHARTLEFDHPFTKEHLVFEIPEPDEWMDYVKKGDLHPEKTLWEIERMERFGRHGHQLDCQLNQSEKYGKSDPVNQKNQKNQKRSTGHSEKAGKSYRNGGNHRNEKSLEKHDFQKWDDEKILLEKRRLSGKEKAHMNFIERGKFGR